ncbi:hypothetical protein P280DRAFT_442772 [Massarina eburnea CBS 473.64]|uniref:Uncharacterized protein n=1 Tax=Massarina eburnea CBS 473.64 TaxID=1395130 RepID=A0A6A6SDJ6_9PLEO|nr:hypothetical protein P280DRAFT_442772 [Massarina eburnea CBS 473.64]
MGFILRTVTKGISTGIGLAGEKYHDRQERKAALAERERSSSDASSRGFDLINPLEPGAETADDERIWMLDEATGPPPSYEASEQQGQRPSPERTVSDLVNDVVMLQDHDALPSSSSEIRTRLPHPIVIPQRRPGTKARGFARAYAPDLEAFGVGQDTFLQFFENFENASLASPWLRTLKLSAGILGMVPGHITMAVSISLQVTAGTAIELQSRYRANEFLDQTNKDVFMPLGLYCMVLMCEDGSGSTENPEFSYETVNLDAAKQISKWGVQKDDAHLSTSTKVLRPIRMVSGKTKVSEMPLEIAPLVYPGLDDMVQRPEIKRDESLKDRMVRHKEFYADYFDRRAKAEYAGNNPDSALTKASSDTSKFHVRFSDPNHPVNNGHIISLVTGGHVVPQPRGRRSRLREVGEDGKLKPKAKREERKVRGPIGLVSKGVRKVLAPKILYLTIVNMPSEEELAEAREMLGLEQKGIKDMLQEMAKDRYATPLGRDRSV